MRVMLIPPAQERHQCQRVISALNTRGASMRIQDRADCLSGLDCHDCDVILVCGEDDMPATLIPAIRQAAEQKVVVVLGDLNHATRLAALENGADDCLSDDISGKELYQHLINLLKIPVSGQGRDTTLEVEDLRVGLMYLDVCRGARQIRLNKREYQLLRYLALNSRRVISRNELIEHVWGISDKANENTLDVYMHRLRSKVDKFEGALPLIHTIRGFGYYLGRSET